LRPACERESGLDGEALISPEETNFGIMGMPVSYEVDGTQYITIQSGWGVDAQRIQDALSTQNIGFENNVPQGGVVRVFAVKK
jgi:alcohol dehydrogenase (cytochrome c)